MGTKYIGITIGPISTAMSYSTKPAGLWFASNLFSTLSRILIEQLLSVGIKKEQIISPYFEVEFDGGTKQKVVLPGNTENQPDCRYYSERGVGMFHDRIIFRADGIGLEKVKTAKAAAISELAALLGLDNSEWLTDFLRIYALVDEVPDDVSPLLALGKKLSAIELEPHAKTKENTNPLLEIMFNNDTIRDTALVPENRKNWILSRSNGNGLRDLAHIAAADKPDQVTMKHQQYYAVLQSDGDSMTKLLEAEKTTGIPNYSKNCLIFCAKAADMILKYSGVPIYAGGDDLLALLPVVGKDLKDSEKSLTIFGFVEELREVFNNTLKKEQTDKFPTISMGISIRFYKSPLYEALEDATNLLYAAKGGRKNACYMDLQKHSGQSAKVLDEAMDAQQPNLYRLLDDIYQKISRKDSKDTVNFLHGAGTQLDRYKELFYLLLQTRAYEEWQPILTNLFDNLYDNVGQAGFKDYLDELVKLAHYIFTLELHIPETIKDDGTPKRDAEGNIIYCEITKEKVKSAHEHLLGAIRMLHFMMEKKGED